MQADSLYTFYTFYTAKTAYKRKDKSMIKKTILLGAFCAAALEILKEINPEYSLKALMLKLQYFGQLMQKAS